MSETIVKAVEKLAERVREHAGDFQTRRQTAGLHRGQED